MKDNWLSEILKDGKWHTIIIRNWDNRDDNFEVYIDGEREKKYEIV